MANGVRLQTWLDQGTKDRFSGMARHEGLSDSALLKRLVDLMLLQERAIARGMRPATYLSVQARAHLHHLAPLPREELLALKRAVSELAAVGRNLNQIARAANRGDWVTGTDREGVKAMLKVCVALRDHVRDLLAANLRSWEQGHDDAR